MQNVPLKERRSPGKGARYLSEHVEQTCVGQHAAGDHKQCEQKIGESAWFDRELPDISEHPAAELGSLRAAQQGPEAGEASAVDKSNSLPETDLAFGEGCPVALIEVDLNLSSVGCNVGALESRKKIALLRQSNAIGLERDGSERLSDEAYRLERDLLPHPMRDHACDIFLSWRSTYLKRRSTRRFGSRRKSAELITHRGGRVRSRRPRLMGGLDEFLSELRRGDLRLFRAT